MCTWVICSVNQEQSAIASPGSACRSQSINASRMLEGFSCRTKLIFSPHRQRHVAQIIVADFFSFSTHKCNHISQQIPWGSITRGLLCGCVCCLFWSRSSVWIVKSKHQTVSQNDAALQLTTSMPYCGAANLLRVRLHRSPLQVFQHRPKQPPGAAIIYSTSKGKLRKLHIWLRHP